MIPLSPQRLYFPPLQQSTIITIYNASVADAKNASNMMSSIPVFTTGCGGHFLPQHVYVYDMEGNQVIDHILRFEQLNEDFSALRH